MSAKSLSGARDPIFLSEWISRAVDEVDLSNLVTDGTDPSQWPANIRNTMALCSDEFLLTALRVARSLVDQICEEEEAGRRPIPGSNWADSVVMNYNQVGELHDGRTNSQDGLGFNDSLDSLGFDHRKVVAEEDNFDDFFGESVIKDGTTLPSNEKDRVEDGDFFSTTAKFLSSLFNNCDDDDGLIRDDMQCIYSLGIVFYVIFSGGERFVELDNQKEPPQELSTEDLEPLPFDQEVSIDLAGKFSILDDIEKEYNPMNDTGDDEVFTSQNPRKRQSQNNNDHEGCYASVESLREKGLPRSLCDLVANMMDCVNATLSGEDSYRTMSEVRSDLQIMLDEPAIYLYDQDMWRLSTTGLQFGDKVFGRNAELSAIKDAYRRSVSGESELVTISGPSGSGKSILAHEFGKYVFAEGGIVLSGKFDQLQLGKPFSALASAFDKYCGIWLHNGELKLTRQEVARQVKSVLGVEAYYLAKMIPNLATILGHEPHPIDNDEDCFNAQKRLQYLLCQFVEIIASSSSATVMLFLDDLQWVDAASIAAVNQLLLTAGNSPNTQFFFLGCYREGDIGNSNPLWKALCNSDLLNARCTDIKLDCMDKNTVNTMVSETLCLSPRLTRTLSSVIHHKTKGNPLFVSQLMISLSKEGLLRPSLIRRRWEWDKEKIQCQQIHDDVAMLLAHSIGKLSEDVKSSLCVLSCFGASSEISFIKILEKALGKSLLVGLDIAVAEGLLDKRDDQYRFSHDRIQEAAYNMMNFLDRFHFHFNYGMALAPLAAGEVGDSILLTAVTQLNLAGPEAVEEKSQNAIVANLNLRAGKKAMEMSDFGAAYSYFDNGISFLRKNHWDEHYGLSLELFDSAAKCALTISDFTSLGLLCQEVVTKAHFFEDKLNVTYFTTCALATSPKLPEAIEKGLDVLSKLGIELRGYESSLEVCVQETEDLLSGYTDDEILNTRRMTDPNMIIAMKFLGKLELGMTQMMPKTVPYVTQRIIQLSLSHGMSPVSPIGFVYFGSYIAKLGDISKGYHYVKLALSLLGKVGSREYAGEVICVATQVGTYVEPLQAAMEFHNEGYTAAMASGDISQATVNIFGLNWLRFSAGVNLQTVREKYSEAQKMMEKTKQVILKTHALQSQRCIFKLIGTDEEPKDVSEEKDILATTSAVFRAHLYQKAYSSFMFRSYDDAKHFAEKFVACAGNVIWANLVFAEAAQAFYTGLISFWVVRKSRGEQQWLERGITSKLALKKWAQASKWTFENKWYLLEAEESFCNNDVEAAKTYYEKAISSAKEHKFVHEEALACELAAYFYLELGERERTVHYFLLAHEKYHEWGAIAKCGSIFKFVESMERFWHGS